MSKRLTLVTALACLLAASRADAQFRAPAPSPEDFHTEIGLMFFTPTPELTLTTCWPIRWLGPAPDRLIVSAKPVMQVAGR